MSIRILSQEVAYFVPEGIVAETDAAILFEIEVGEYSEEVWLPKSQIEYIDNREYYPVGEWSAPVWLLEKRGLI